MASSMFERNIPSHLQNVAKYRVYEIRKIGGLRHYQRGGNLKKGEVNFERGGSDPLGNYAWSKSGKSNFKCKSSSNLCEIPKSSKFLALVNALPTPPPVVYMQFT